MFITEDLKSRIHAMLTFLDVRADWLAQSAALEPGWAEADPTRCYAAERALMVSVECVTDVASDLIDALVMREAGSYADLVRVLVEEQVVERAWFESFLPLIEMRQALLRQYRDVAPQDVEQAVRAIAPLLPPYADWIRRYLNL